MFVGPRRVWQKDRDIGEPTQKAILFFDAGREDLVLQVKYQGELSDFGWLIPVPSLPQVRKASMDCFYELSRFTQDTGFGAAVINGMFSQRHAKLEHTIDVIAQKTIGAYDIAILATSSAGGLREWLDRNHFVLPKDENKVTEQYICQNWFFVAVKIHLCPADGYDLVSGTAKQGQTARTGSWTQGALAQGELHPLVISFDTEKAVFPLKISSLNGSTSELLIYVLARQALHSEWLARESQRSLMPWAKKQQLELEARFGLPHGSEPVVDPIRPYHFQVLSRQVPQTARALSRLSPGPWMLTKFTWTFQPAEMRDLIFEPEGEVLSRIRSEQPGRR